MRKSFATALLLAALALPAFASPGFAQTQDRDHNRDRVQDHRGGPDRRDENRPAHAAPAPHRDFHPDRHWRGNIHNFRVHDEHYWHGGRWYHGAHGGRVGWYWVLGGAYYYYPAPVYPYPDPYIPAAIETPIPVAPSYYYCVNPQGYYPYVPVCYAPWQAVRGY